MPKEEIRTLRALAFGGSRPISFLFSPIESDGWVCFFPPMMIPHAFWRKSTQHHRIREWAGREPPRRAPFYPERVRPSSPRDRARDRTPRERRRKKERKRKREKEEGRKRKKKRGKKTFQKRFTSLRLIAQFQILVAVHFE